MTDSLSVCLVAPAAALAACAGLLLPQRFGGGRTRRIVTWLAGLQALAAGAFAVLWQAGGGAPLHWTSPAAFGPPWLKLSLYYDGYTALMLLLVGFVGWVICRYSVRYLDGQADQQRYFRWAGFTIGAVALMVLSGNLLLFLVCWVLTSFGLHHLLTYYADRPAARRAAWTKFGISRLGDIALIGAVVLTYLQFRTLEFPELYAAIGSGIQDGSLVNATSAWAGWLLMFGAITKSAQVPFHGWLPLTMETPTPVSALMHAGIVNAGGYLMIRSGLLVSLAPGALLALAILGATTACFASLIMLTESSVKRSLAYSTIAQMGFMMLQCGLGAYAAAMLHILAHSLYKAHAFLGSGGVLAQRAATSGVRSQSSRTSLVWIGPTAAIISALVFLAAVMLAGQSLSAKPGGMVLLLVLSLATASWATQMAIWAAPWAKLKALGLSGVLAAVYAAAYLSVGLIVNGSPASNVVAPVQWPIVILAALGFGGLAALQASLQGERRPAWLSAAYVHASNGFYFDALSRRLFSRKSHKPIAH